MSREDDLVFEIRTHLLYELKWLIAAASRFQDEIPGDPHVALLDSATVHGRNLFEFAQAKDTRAFSLAALGGEPKKSAAWDRWANNRVTHMLWREHHRAPYPSPLDNDRPDRFMAMADAVLERLEDGGATIPAGAIKGAFDSVIGAARDYWRSPSESTHNALQDLYDDSRDTQRDYQ